MFYYLLYNSSFSFIVDNRLFLTILYGSILYILTHAILNYSNLDVLNIINNYFWYIFVLDVISLLYGIYQSLTNTITSPTDNNLHVSFNLLKNKINTILERKNDLTISDDSSFITKSESTYVPTSTPRQPQRIITKMPLPSMPPIPEENPQHYDALNKNSLSTPITQLCKSTPLSHLRMPEIPEPIITEDGYAESVSGSDVGSVMDLDDFEKSL